MSDVILVGGWLGAEDLRGADRLSGRLATRGVASRLVCIEGGGGGPGIIECPNLGVRWQRPWAIRRLTSGTGLEPPELIHVLGLDMAAVGLEMAERWECPYVLSVEDFPASGERLRFSRRWCRGLIVPSQDLADELVLAYGVPSAWIDVISPGIFVPESLRGLDRSPSRATLSRLNGASEADAGWAEGYRIAVVGTTVTANRIEGLAVFLEAARRVLDSGRDVEFVVAWSRGEEAGLRRLADWLHLKDHLTLVDRQLEGESIWSVLDVYCQSSVTPTTGRGIGLALSHAVPVVASDVQGIQSWIDPGATGLLVPAGDSDSLAEAILDLLSHPEQARTLGLAGQQHVVKCCHPDREADLLAAIYRRVLQEPLPDATHRPAPPAVVPFSPSQIRSV